MMAGILGPPDGPAPDASPELQRLYFDVVSRVANPKAANGSPLVYQWRFSDADPWHLIDRQRLDPGRAGRGAEPDPDARDELGRLGRHRQTGRQPAEDDPAAPHPPPRHDPRDGADAQGLPQLERESMSQALGDPRRGLARRRCRWSGSRRPPAGTSPRRCWSPTTRPGRRGRRSRARARPHRPRALRGQPSGPGSTARVARSGGRSPAPILDDRRGDGDAAAARRRRLPGAGNGGRRSTRPSTPATRPQAPRAAAPPRSPVPDELGPMPAWLVPGSRATPGRSSSTASTAPRRPACGWCRPCTGPACRPLLISYREDLGAPPSPDGFHHMGLTEWRDLGAAARYALAHGARRLILVGYSMGGAHRQPVHAALAAGRAGSAGLVLDAPALNWKAILRVQRRPRWASPPSPRSRSSGRSAPASMPTGTASTPSDIPTTSSCRYCSSTAPRRPGADLDQR